MSNVNLSLRAMICVLVIAFIMIFNHNYTHSISHTFNYMGYLYHPLTMDMRLISFLFALCPAFLLPTKTEQPSTYVIWIMYLCIYIPSCTVAFYLDLSLDYYLFQSVVLLSLALLALMNKITIDNIPCIQVSQKQLVYWLLGSLVLIVAVILYKYRQVISLFGWEGIYNQRALFHEKTGRSFMRYVIPWTMNILAPLLLAIALSQKRYVIAFLAIVAEFIIYFITSYKMALLIPFLFLCIYGYLRFFPTPKTILPMLIAFTLIIPICTLLDKVAKTYIFTSLFTQRVFAAGGMLTAWYWQFFTNHPHVFMSNSVLAPVVKYPYKDSIVHEISLAIHGKAYGANANFWSSAYADFSYLGIISHTLILALYMILFDSITRQYSQHVRISFMLFIAFYVANSSLPTALLSGGLGFLLISLWIFQGKKAAT